MDVDGFKPSSFKGTAGVLLEFVGNNRQSLGAGGERRSAKRLAYEIHRVDWLWCDGISDVFLRRVRLRRRARVRYRRPHLSRRRSLPQTCRLAKVSRECTTQLHYRKPLGIRNAARERFNAIRESRIVRSPATCGLT